MTELTDTYDKINEELNKSGDNYTKAARTVICTEVCAQQASYSKDSSEK